MTIRRYWKHAALASALALAWTFPGCGASPPPPAPTPAAPAAAPAPEAHHKAKTHKGRHAASEEDDMGIREKREQRRKTAQAAESARAD